MIFTHCLNLSSFVRKRRLVYRENFSCSLLFTFILQRSTDLNFSGDIEPPVTFETLKYSSFSVFSDDLVALIDEMKLRPCLNLTFQGWHSMISCIAFVVSIKDVFFDKFKRTLERMRHEVTLVVAWTVFLSDMRYILETVEVQCTLTHNRAGVRCEVLGEQNQGPC